ncbi:hypothetical protein [Metallosphaera yellowstonensis]|uniref:hypothetical protein n=1 Tax=Metallosphaera yellowstonensis TaxID=1111107 RepID=UPI00155A63CC|nr:hypothetical protein [Metallosphaera yellowstonensis]
MISQPMTDTAHKDGGEKLSGQDIEVSLDWPQRSGDNHVCPSGGVPVTCSKVIEEHKLRHG